MKFINLARMFLSSVSNLHRKLKKRMIFRVTLEVAKMAVVIAVSIFVLLEWFGPGDRSPGLAFPGKLREFFSFTRLSPQSDARAVLSLANMIHLITHNQLPQGKVLRYAGLIYHASKKYGVNPLEIIAIIMAESEFKENSVNTKTGDYGLGQINWEHWGKPNGLTSQDLLDPSINIYFTCLVYKFFDQDFGKYNRGNGIKCNTYLLNVKSILSTLNAFIELNKNDYS